MCPALGGGWNHPWKFNEPGQWLQCCAGPVLLCQLVLPQCCGLQSSWAVIQHIQGCLYSSSFRNFCSFLNHQQGRRVCGSGPGGVWEWNEICGLIRMYQIISMPCAEQLGWILWRGRAWEGTWSGTSLGSASPPLSLPLASGRLSQPVLS